MASRGELVSLTSGLDTDRRLGTCIAPTYLLDRIRNVCRHILCISAPRVSTHKDSKYMSKGFSGQKFATCLPSENHFYPFP